MLNMTIIHTQEESRELQVKLFRMGYWWGGGETDLFYPPHQTYYLIFDNTPSRLRYCLPAFKKNHEITLHHY